MMTAELLTSQVLAYAAQRSVGAEPYYSEIPGLSISRNFTPTDLAPTLYRPILCLVLQGSKQIRFGSETIISAEAHSLIVGLDLPTFARITDASPERPHVALSTEIDMATIGELAAELDNFAVEQGQTGAITSGAADAAIFNAMQRLFGLIDTPAAASILRPLIMREIHFWLLCVPHGKLLRQLVQANSHAARISQAIVEIRRRYDEPLRIPDLARAAGMSESAFHEHFKHLCGTTPLQFQKRLRLIEARRLLVSNSVSVTSAAAHVGYESPTQFSREFARMFGVSPRGYRQAVFEDA